MLFDLTFVRVKRLRDTQPGKQPNELKIYVARLKKYLHGKGVDLIDYSDNTAIQSWHYGKGDHLNAEKGRPLFTRILSRDLKSNYQ